MAQKPSSSESLVSALRDEGPQSPAKLMSLLKISQPTLFRAARSQPQKVVSMGGRRNRKLAALRTVRGIGSSLPVFTVSPEGDIGTVGKILLLHPNSLAFVIEASPSMPRYYPKLPSFLEDIRPSGYMGDAFARSHADLHLPLFSSSWSPSNILEAIAKRGEDLVGNTIVGAESFERFVALKQSDVEVISSAKAAERYVSLAESASTGSISGSIVGGNQPKFSAVVEGRDGAVKHVLVKFSPAGDSFSARRWRDLLICESLALEVLGSHNFSVAQSRILEAGDRIFLEVARFDRVGPHGRRRVLSLSSLGGAWGGNRGNWAASGALLERERKISPEDQRNIQRLECFARMIGNNDRGPDNLSFLWRPGDSGASLAPIYDMLPMLYAPDAKGENPGKHFTLPTYDHTLMGVWQDTRALAVRYWEKVREDSRLSGDLTKIAEHHIKLLKRA
ncbi:MAG TPA: HipA domain-containing protein [Bdellovibrionota bacterium]